MPSDPELIRPQAYNVPADALALLTREQALRYRVCPVSISPPNPDGVRTLALASADPRNAQLLRELQRVLGCGISLVPAAEDDIRQAIDKHYDPNRVNAPTDLLMESGGVTVSGTVKEPPGLSGGRRHAVDERRGHRPACHRATGDGYPH